MFCIASVLLPHACLLIFLRSILIQQTKFFLIRGPIIYILNYHVHSSITFYGRQHAAVQPQVVHPCFRQMFTRVAKQLQY